MNRTVNIEIGGVTWPMCLTLRAYGEICARYGGMKECMATLTALEGEPDVPGLIEEYTWLADQLMWALHTAVDEDYDHNPPTQLELKDLLTPGDIPYLQRKVLDAIIAGQSREVGAEPPKNAGGAEAEE